MVVPGVLSVTSAIHGERLLIQKRAPAALDHRLAVKHTGTGMAGVLIPSPGFCSVTDRV
ncbi:MAG: hypothetical protein ABRQ24_02645 [Syntrophomonadaceae bacterium]